MTSISRFFRYLNWLANPFHGLSTSRVYDLIGTASPTRDAMYLNLGYWRDAENVDDASRALAMLVADAGGMSAEDTVLDCGFGFADQDILWARERQPRRIIGLNVTESQVRTGRRRVIEAGLDGRIELRTASATRMPIGDESVDLVTALESAFHFHTREDFFREAFRVLRPGGRLVTADILPMPRAGNLATRLRQWLSWHLVASRFNIPRENRYLPRPYKDKLHRAGFEDTRVESIRGDVYAPLHEFLAGNPASLDRQHPVARLLAKATLWRSADNVYAGLDYVLAVARKPSRD